MLSAFLSVFSPRVKKILGAVLLVIAVLALIFGIITAVKNWQVDTYNKGFRAGALNTQEQWDAEKIAALNQQQATIVQDAVNSNNAVQKYLDQILAQKPEVIRVRERTTEYVQSPDGAVVCHTPDGVQLLQGHRNAIGYPSAAPGDTGAVPGIMPVAGGAENQP